MLLECRWSILSSLNLSPSSDNSKLRTQNLKLPSNSALHLTGVFVLMLITAS
jgi:hypothetical protein